MNLVSRNYVVLCFAAGNGYLCNVPPSQFTACFEQQLPEALSGAAFLQQYGPHLDSVTTVDPEQASDLQEVLVGLGEVACCAV